LGLGVKKCSMSNIEFRLNFGVKTTENYFCEKCHFISCKRSDWDIHTSTRKHKIRTNYADLEQKNAEMSKIMSVNFEMVKSNTELHIK